MRDDADPPQPGVGDPVVLEQRGRALLVTLNRASALNALNPEVIATLESALHRAAGTPRIYGIALQAEGRAFCAGGDLRAMYEWHEAGALDAAQRYLAQEYQHCWTLERFIKPHVALMNGPVMGGGAGITLYGTHRVAGEGFSFSMPETGIGFFPDVGASDFLARLPGRIGLYLGLTGDTIGAADAYRLRLATHCIPAARFPEIVEHLVEGDPIDAVLDVMHEAPGEGRLDALRQTIDRVFAAPSVEAILAALDAEAGEHAEWARRIAADLRTRSPLALKVTFELLSHRAKPFDLKAALQQDYGLAVQFLRGHDFFEGIRARLIDKDQQPRWEAETLADVGCDRVAELFAEGSKESLALQDHWTLVD